MDYDELFKRLNNAPVCIVRGLETKELTGVVLQPSFQLYDSLYRSLINKNSKVYNYLMEELAWYFRGERTTNIIEKFAPFWNKLKDSNGLINSNYGYLTMYDPYPKNSDGITPIDWCIDSLTADCNTRQAIILYNKPEYVNKTKDFICTQTQHFLFRNNHLNSYVYMRSSDAIRGLSFDIPWWQLLTNIIANSVDMHCGDTTIFIGSSHVYKGEFELISQLATTPMAKFKIRTNLNIKEIRRHRNIWNKELVEQMITMSPLNDSITNKYDALRNGDSE